MPVGEIVQYDVSVTPDVPRALRRRIFDMIESQHRSSAFGGKLVAYDGMANLFSYGPLPKAQYALEVSLEGRPGKEERRFAVKIRQVSSVNLSLLEKFVKGELNYTPYDVINSLEVIMRHPMTQKGIIVGRSCYTRANAEPIAGGLEVWKGFFSSLRPAAGRLLLNVDTTATAFYSPGPLLNLVGDICADRDGKLAPTMDPRNRQNVERAIRNLKVEVSHRPGIKRKFKVMGLHSKSADEISFSDESGKSWTVTSYFADKYNVKLRFPRFPCVVVGSPDKQTFLPIEVCVIPDGQRYPRKLDENQTSDMIKIANQKPFKRLENIRTAASMLDQCREHLSAFKMSFGAETVQLNGRVLPPPSIVYGERSREKTIAPSQGAWNMRDKQVETGANVDSWSVLVFGRCHPAEVSEFTRELVITCRDTGMSFNQRAQDPPVVMAGQDIERSIKDAYSKAESAFGKAPQFILVILPSTDSFLYGEVKRVGDTMLGVPTQCMQMKHLRKVSKQYCANLCLKINLKLGGTNLHLGNQLAFIRERPTIVFGADVTHPGIGESDKPSIAAVVASMDVKLSRYAANVRVQGSRVEIIGELKAMVKEHLVNFRAANKVPPHRILFYRDGVGEGQFAQVTKHEIGAIRAACMELDPAYKPTITFILVQKRHHTRLFPTNQNDADRSGNIPAGTVVDSQITHPTMFDFWLCSHAGLQGTSRPTRYVVVHDDHKFSCDDLEVLTNNLCYTFARCTRSVSVATPAYYAHLVAFRARFHFRPDARQEPSSFCQVTKGLDQRMYFI